MTALPPGTTAGPGLGKISPIDYGVFGLSLVIPVIIAVYYACVKTQRTTSQYMLGDRKVTAIPMAFSLTVSYLSAVTITGKTDLKEWPT